MKRYLFIFAAFLSMNALASEVDISEVDANSILTEKCSRCHAAPNPQNYSPEKWDMMVDKMAPNAQLNEEEKEALKALNP